MRLVNGQTINLALRQHVQRIGPQQRLRRHVQQLDRAGAHALNGVGIGVRIQRTVQIDRWNIQIGQRGHLILHERNQRRYDYRQPVKEQRRQLKTEALAAARGHDHQRVALGHYILDDLLLMGAEFIIAKNRFEQLLGRGAGIAGRFGKSSARLRCQAGHVGHKMVVIPVGCGRRFGKVRIIKSGRRFIVKRRLGVGW